MNHVHAEVIAIIEAYLDGVYSRRDVAMRLDIYHHYTVNAIDRILRQPRKQLMLFRGY
jgi:hypothetical protein